MNKKLLFPRLFREELTNLFRIMKISVILFMIGTLTASASSVFSQSASKLNLSSKGGSIRQLFDKIEAQSDYKFFYLNEQFDDSRIVNQNYSNVSVNDILENVFEDKSVKYKIFENHLVVLSPSIVAITAKSEKKQGVTVSGNVKDATTGENLTGVTVSIQGTTTGTVTDISGNFSINVPNVNSILVFSYVGYLNEQIAAGQSSPINLKLSPDIKSLDEVVVIGYGVQKKKDITGSVAVVNVDEMNKLKVSGVAEAIQGRIAGVSVQSSGEPGRMADIRIRGIGSFSGAQPLYVVDGLIVNDANHFNSSEIESVQVLKDASATALYGSRGANGVVIVTTKKGQEGEAKVDISSSIGWQEIGKKIKMMGTEEFLYYNQLSYINSGREWPGAPAVGEQIPNTDWQKAIFEMGRVQDHNIAVSGGSKSSKYMVDAGYYSQDGVLVGPNYNRYTLRVNTEGKKSFITFGENISLMHTDQKLTNLGQSSFTNALSMPPVIPVYDPNEPSGRGGYGYGSGKYQTYNYNPVGLQESLDDRLTNNRVLGNLYTELELIKGLKYKANFGLDHWYGTRKQKDYGYTIRYASEQIKFNDKLWENFDQRTSLLMEHTLTYNLSVGKHSFDVLAGYTNQDNKYKYLANEAYNQKVADKWQIDLAADQNNMWGSEQENRMISFLGRINYNYDERYLLQLNVRRDGSSRFGDKNRFGNFPSASFGWTISNEAFFESLKQTINSLKFRVSYGVIGDQQALGNYDYIPSVDNSGPYQGLYSFYGKDQHAAEGAIITQRANPYLQWESKETTNFGLDFGVFQNKLTGSVDVFRAISSKLLVDLPLALTTGVGTDGDNTKMWTNYGKMQNEGVELSLDWRDKVGDFQYNINGNISFLKNKILRLGVTDGYREGAYGQVNRTQEGRSISDFYLVHTDGIFQSWDEVYAHTTTLSDGTVKIIQPNAQPGDVRYVDFNKDGKIDLAGDRQWTGSPLPKFEAGLNASVSYKNFDLNTFWTARYGNKIFSGQRQQLEAMDAPNNMPAYLKPWTKENPSTTTPRPLYGPNDNVLFQSDRWMEDGSFIKIKNIQLGYTIPVSELTKSNFIQKFRIYASVQNLYTFTSYKGYDPELAGCGVFEQGCDWGQYPPVRTYMCGVQLSF